jgi:hypothetical protein
METCATDNNGSYGPCTLATIRSIEPTLNDAGARLSVASTANTYSVEVVSDRDAGAVTFTLARAANGETARDCTTTTADKGGCSDTTGTW